MKDIKVSVDEENYIETKKILYERGMSFQEFVNGLLSLSSINDQRLVSIIDTIKQRRDVSKKTIKIGNKEIFHKLKDLSPLNNYYVEPIVINNDNDIAKT